MTRSRRWTAAVALALLASVGSAGPAAAARIALYDPPNLAGISGHTWNDTMGAPLPGTTYCFSAGFGGDVFANPIGWAVSNLTGFSLSGLLGDYQRGIDALVPGSTACQVKGTKMGFVLNSETTGSSNPLRGLQHIRTWSLGTAPRPWLGRGPDASLRVESRAGVSQAVTTGNGAAQYVTVAVSLADTTTMKSIWYVVSLFDNRWACRWENIHPDGIGGTPNYNVDTCFWPGMRYVTLPAESQAASADPNLYATHITRQNLRDAVTDINARFGTHYSTDPDDYAMNIMSSIFEMYTPPGTTSRFAGWVDDVRASVDTEPVVAAQLPSQQPPAGVPGEQAPIGEQGTEEQATQCPPTVPSKLTVTRASTTGGQLDVLARLTSRASGHVELHYDAAGTRTSATAPVADGGGFVRLRRALSERQLRAGTGLLTVSYPGDGAARAQTVRLRAAENPARLALSAPRVVGGRLRASGTITRRARGHVRLVVEYQVGCKTRTRSFRAPIRDGRWRLDAQLPAKVVDEISRRTGDVQSYAIYTGSYLQRIRGEMRTFRVLGNR